MIAKAYMDGTNFKLLVADVFAPAALAIDAMSYDPSARALALALVLKQNELAKTSLARSLAIAPLHPASLAGLAWSTATGQHQGGKTRADELLREARDLERTIRSL